MPTLLLISLFILSTCTLSNSFSKCLSRTTFLWFYLYIIISTDAINKTKSWYLVSFQYSIFILSIYPLKWCKNAIFSNAINYMFLECWILGTCLRWMFKAIFIVEELIVWSNVNDAFLVTLKSTFYACYLLLF